MIWVTLLQIEVKISFMVQKSLLSAAMLAQLATLGSQMRYDSRYRQLAAK